MDTLQQMTADVRRFQSQQEIAQRQRDDLVRARGDEVEQALEDCALRRPRVGGWRVFSGGDGPLRVPPQNCPPHHPAPPRLTPSQLTAQQQRAQELNTAQVARSLVGQDAAITETYRDEMTGYNSRMRAALKAAKPAVSKGLQNAAELDEFRGVAGALHTSYRDGERRV